MVCAGKDGEGNYTVDPVAETVTEGRNASPVHCPGIGAVWDIKPEDDAAHVVAERSRFVSHGPWDVGVSDPQKRVLLSKNYSLHEATRRNIS